MNFFIIMNVILLSTVILIAENNVIYIGRDFYKGMLTFILLMTFN